MATPIPSNRAEFSLSEIARVCGGELKGGKSDEIITGIATDSRAVTSGCLFVAIRGERLDGHDFVEQALQRGASCVLAQRASLLRCSVPVVEVNDTTRALGDLAQTYRNRFSGIVVAITGSVGKTTTKELAVKALAATEDRVLSTVGNLNNLVGLPMTLFTLDREYDVAVLELGSSAPGEIARLAEITRPQVGVVTSVALAHTLGFGTIARVAEEKASLLKALSASGTAIYNIDSEPLRPLLAEISAERRISFGSGKQADVRLVSRIVEPELPTRCRYEIAQLDRILDAELPLLGKAAALDAAAALAVLLAIKGPQGLSAACSAFRQVKPLSGRLKPVFGPRQSLLLDDTYNSNPESALASLGTGRELAEKRDTRALAILGDMAELGDHSQSEHERIGREAVGLGYAALILCGEEMAAARDAALRASRDGAADKKPEIHHVVDPRDAIPIARALIEKGDVVLIKGSRFMEMERVLNGLTKRQGDVT
ncbi:MAG: UDP-N-acetylmuramoyl-tripeptide--D-alanyl-D-alanine ligase [Deltaproteobacteria bacterium]|nr:UDP-N-acetylmuramoyl-tripeptide--D-alanyl-D-alanine ligase [Deltaproteobacteria bacterium]